MKMRVLFVALTLAVFAGIGWHAFVRDSDDASGALRLEGACRGETPVSGDSLAYVSYNDCRGFID